MFRIAVKVACVSFLLFASVAWSCGLAPAECSVRALQAAGVLGVAVLLGMIVVRRVAESVFTKATKSDGSEPPVESSRGTDQPTS